MHEHIVAAILRLNESVPFGSIEPLNRSSIQETDLTCRCVPGNMPWHEAVSAYVQESASDAQSKAAITDNNAKPTVTYIERLQRAYKENLNDAKSAYNDRW